ncbi:MAG: hypothetical protein WAO22_08935 [bacterium]|jgi:hypothetical protein|nr:hypothetical protein [Bacillota bacterium]
MNTQSPSRRFSAGAREEEAYSILDKMLAYNTEDIKPSLVIYEWLEEVVHEISSGSPKKMGKRVVRRVAGRTTGRALRKLSKQFVCNYVLK